MANDSGSKSSEIKRIKLKVHNFKGNYTKAEIASIGNRYIDCTIALQDKFNVPLPFSRTKDGVSVYFRATKQKLLGRDINGYRHPESSRIKRLHWIIPIIQGETKDTVWYRDCTGSELGESCDPDAMYRLYVVPEKMYVVFLRTYRGKKGGKSFNLVSAYNVTETWTIKMLERLFPEIKNPPKRI